MRKVLLLFIWMMPALIWASDSGEKVYQGFSGGMMLHTGYLFGQDKNAPSMNDQLCSPQGATFGIGGALRINLWNHLRVGAEGFASTMQSTMTDCRQLLQPGSYVRYGYGGLLADACWRGEKIWTYVGAATGGGAQRALYLMEGNQSDWQEEEHSVFHKQSFCYVDPYVGIDYCMTQKVHLTFRIDWMVGFSQHNLCLPTGPRLCFGFMFCH